ncbi:hypothetical protein ACFQV2_18815 [Actinokineospora soli]|uniref:Small integral membrane protein n=1 Tax=Actinokineospora soli TaxID=1048753 RepID=A0ABW2TN94_9PSEU
MDQIRDRLWNGQAEQGADYLAAVVEQYKTYVDMADRVSARRSAANTFFLTLNSAIFTLFGVIWTGKPTSAPWWLVVPLLALLLQCWAWFSLVRSYRQLNNAKFQVIGALEERLPASPYWKAEWVELGKGEDPKRYRSLSSLEQLVPVSFAVLYVMGFVAAMAA